jgi:hypothetical protein
MRKIPARRCLVPMAAAAACLGAVLPAAAAASTAHTARAPAVSPTIPYGMSALTYRRMLAQIPLDDAATLIRQAVTRPGAGHSGFVQIAVDDDHNRLMVYWHGPIPADIARLLASLRHRMQVEVAATRYSTATLDGAVSQVLHARSGLHVTEAGPLSDGSGIQVGVAETALPAVKPQRLFGVSVPVKVVPGQVPRAAACYPNSLDTLGPPARCYDTALYWGGAVINDVSVTVNGRYYSCSTGFGVHSTVDSKQYMLTASHCGNGGNTMMNGNLTATLGPVYGLNHSHDDEAILTSPGASYYDGPGIYHGDTHNVKNVAGEQPSNIGDWVCESGAFGGVMCNMQIPKNGLNQTWQYIDIVGGIELTVSRVAVTTKGTGGDNGGFITPGDSGGPVFALAANNEVTAKGINLAYNTANNNNAFMTIDWISSDFKVQVNTG